MLLPGGSCDRVCVCCLGGQSVVIFVSRVGRWAVGSHSYVYVQVDWVVGHRLWTLIVCLTGCEMER